jgi:hypothetical protein
VLKFLLAAHLVLVVFTIGPLMHVAKTASRGIRHGDATATRSAARSLRIYAYVSVLVIIAGFGLMSQKRTVTSVHEGGYQSLSPYNSKLTITTKENVAEFSDVWIWLSLLLWLLAMAVVLAELVPTMTNVTKLIEAEDSVVTYTARVIAAGSVVAAIFFAIIVLMVYKPGS